MTTEIIILSLIAAVLDVISHGIVCDMRERRAVASRIERRLRRRR